MTKIATPFSGGCACGAIRYESTAKPVLMFHCHCRDCQRASGGPFSSYVIVPTEAFKLLEGSPRFHASPSEQGGMTRRGFCPDCGAPVVVKPDTVPQFVAIRTTSLDDPSWFSLEVGKVYSLKDLTGYLLPKELRGERGRVIGMEGYSYRVRSLGKEWVLPPQNI